MSPLLSHPTQTHILDLVSATCRIVIFSFAIFSAMPDHPSPLRESMKGMRERCGHHITRKKSIEVTDWWWNNSRNIKHHHHRSVKNANVQKSPLTLLHRRTHVRYGRSIKSCDSTQHLHPSPSFFCFIGTVAVVINNISSLFFLFFLLMDLTAPTSSAREHKWGFSCEHFLSLVNIVHSHRVHTMR